MKWGRRAERTEVEQFPGFAELSRVHTGETSELYRAMDLAAGRVVALKVLDVQHPPPDAYEVFADEARPLGSPSAHPNIVPVHGTFQTETGRVVAVSELCRGSAVDVARGRGRALGAREVIGMGIKVAGALEAANRAGVIHRQVRPQNILITTYGQPGLADFGVARLRASTPATAGVVGPMSRHTSPEVLEGGRVGPATDVYSLASSLYTLVAGHPAFYAFEDEPPVSFILRIIRDPVPPIVDDDVPVALSDVLIGAMDKAVERRPQSAKELAGLLQGIEVAQGWPETTLPLWDEFPLPLAPFDPTGPRPVRRPVGAYAEGPAEMTGRRPAEASATGGAPRDPALALSAPRPPTVVQPVPIKVREVITREPLAPGGGRPTVSEPPPPLPRRRT